MPVNRHFWDMSLKEILENKLHYLESNEEVDIDNFLAALPCSGTN